MQDEMNELTDHEKIQTENQYLKMKLMLEKGAEFGGDGLDELDPELEHEFLKHVMAFEEQYERADKITVFEKVGSPDRFLKPELIDDENIRASLDELMEHLYDNGIGLGVCSPNVPPREVYRFIIEELFPFEVDDIKVEGMVQHFIYDEFHEDPVYESSRIATEHCMLGLFDLENEYWQEVLLDENLKLNNDNSLSKNQFVKRIDNFKKSFDRIDINKITGISCVVDDLDAIASGVFDITTCTKNHQQTYAGDWKVCLKKISEYQQWKVVSINLEKIPW